MCLPEEMLVLHGACSSSIMVPLAMRSGQTSQQNILKKVSLNRQKYIYIKQGYVLMVDKKVTKSLQETHSVFSLRALVPYSLIQCLR